MHPFSSRIYAKHRIIQLTYQLVVKKMRLATNILAETREDYRLWHTVSHVLSRVAWLSSTNRLKQTAARVIRNSGVEVTVELPKKQGIIFHRTTLRTSSKIRTSLKFFSNVRRIISSAMGYSAACVSYKERKSLRKANTKPTRVLFVYSITSHYHSLSSSCLQSQDWLTTRTENLGGLSPTLTQAHGYPLIRVSHHRWLDSSKNIPLIRSIVCFHMFCGKIRKTGRHTTLRWISLQSSPVHPFVVCYNLKPVIHGNHCPEKKKAPVQKT